MRKNKITKISEKILSDIKNQTKNLTEDEMAGVHSFLFRRLQDFWLDYLEKMGELHEEIGKKQ